MKRDLMLTGVAAVLVCAYLIVRPLVTRQTATDEDQVRTLIASGERAIERRDLNDAMACVSRNYKDSNGLTYRALRVRAAQNLRSAPVISIKGTVQSIQVAGDDAKVRYSVTVQGDGELFFNGTLYLDLKREPVWRCLIFRGKGWKLIAAEGYGSILE